MGLFDKIRNEFIDIIEWVDDSPDTIVWKFPRYQNEIKMSSSFGSMVASLHSSHR